MKKREKIILILTLIVVVYGALDFFILSKKGNLQGSEQLLELANKTTAEFATNSMARILKIDIQSKKNDLETVISKIESDWGHDPFVQPIKVDPFAPKPPPPIPVSGFAYSGYMKVEDSLFAVINGVEYKTGETIPVYDYTVIKITHQKVILQRGTEQVVIYLKEE
jgi:hypothetical protein